MGSIMLIHWKETFSKMNNIHCTFLSKTPPETQSKTLSLIRTLDFGRSFVYLVIFWIFWLGLQLPLGLKIALSCMKTVCHF
jgi:hypothetical protein